MMLESLHLCSFKGFRDFSIDVTPFTCLVGLNSKGKTSILHALRLIHDMYVFALGGKDLPDFSGPRWEANPSPTLARFALDDPAAIWLHRNTSEPCQISVTASSGLSVQLEIRGPNHYRLDVCIDGASVRNSLDVADNRALLQEFFMLRPEFVPPVGPVSPAEPLVTFPEMQQRIDQGRIAECWRSRLYWLYNDGKRQEFAAAIELIQRYFPATKVWPPRLTHDAQARVVVQFDEESTTLDISHSGGGMRTLLNLAVVLTFAETGCWMFDEPDSHLHGSLQRAVARMLLDFAAERNVQVIVATHAPDFIAELPPDVLAWVDRAQAKARRPNSLGEMLVNLGTVSSADAVRAYGADKVLFVEGTLDRTLLERILGPLCSSDPFRDPNVIVARLPNGRGDAKHLCMYADLLKETLKLDVRILAIVDNDFDIPHTPSDQSDTSSAARVCALPRKEVENFLIEPPVFLEALRLAAADREKRGRYSTVPSESELKSHLREVLDDATIRDSVKYQVTCRYEESLASNLHHATRRKQGEEWFQEKWRDFDWALQNCPGKQVLRMLRAWVKSSFGVNVENSHLAEASRAGCDELTELVSTINSHFYTSNSDH